MPRPTHNYRDQLGRRLKVPAGLRGICDERFGGCGVGSVTNGTETAIAERDKFWNGYFYYSRGWLAFFLDCKTKGCRSKVQYVTKWHVGQP